MDAIYQDGIYRDMLSVGSEFSILSKEMIGHYVEKMVVYDE